MRSHSSDEHGAVTRRRRELYLQLAAPLGMALGWALAIYVLHAFGMLEVLMDLAREALR